MLFKIDDSITKEYDVIVVGGGLGGMTAANVLGKRGKKVLLLEAHNKLGGFATWFYRGENRAHVFDVSLHGFPVGMIKTCRRYWNQAIADSIVQLKDVRFNNPQFQIQTDFTRTDFTRHLIETFQIDPKIVEDFFFYLSKMNYYDQSQQTAGELFHQFFPHRNDVVRFLMEPITYANGHTLEDPALSYGIVFSNFMSKGVYTFLGSTDQLIKKMKEELLNNGVDIKLQTPISRIVVEKNHVRGVELSKNSQVILSQAVISNAHLSSTLFNLTGMEYFSEEFQQKAKQLRTNSSSCQVYFGLKAETPKVNVGDLVFTSTHPTFDTTKVMGHPATSRTFSFYNHERPAIVCSTNAHYQDWKKLNDFEYKNEKEKLEKTSLTELEKLLPGVRDYIEVMESATPLTVERYTRHPQGASFGTKFEGLELSMNLSREIQGLFHAGSVGIIMSGWLGAANYGVINANNVEAYLSH